MRLIDVDKVNPSDILIFADGPMTQEQFNRAVKSLLYGQPIIDPESLRARGQWIECVCSRCGKEPYRKNDNELPNYCPHCGARMCEED